MARSTNDRACTTFRFDLVFETVVDARQAEFVPNEDRVSPPVPMAFVMKTLAETQYENACTLNELSDMLGGAGLAGVEAHPTRGSQTIVVAHR
jgi:hypothetical protein